MKHHLTLIFLVLFLGKTYFANACKANFTYTIDGSYVTFKNTSIGTNFSSNWVFGNGATSVAFEDSAVFYDNGVFFVALTVNDGNCIDTKIDTLFINNAANCNAMFYACPTPLPNFNIVIYNFSVFKNGTSFAWDFGDGSPTDNTLVPIHTFNKFDKFNICLTITEPNCNSAFCDSLGMDSTGKIFKTAMFTLKVIDKTSLLKTSSISKVKAHENDEIIYISPNPFTNKIQIKNLTPNSIIEIKNLLGQVVYNGSYSENLDFGYLKNGLYFLSIPQLNHKTVKLVKE